ncbi:ATP-binding protein [Streptomyces marincola]|uniref:ATP-binding protein n=1 Tax=Streptomyces marincola TaxID=2878388 RepID=UPI001CF4FB6E|nr:tetratricopeptide repeat protein [Streptomyces marincola]UCM90487.1 tetratricopeptide repeat protein [Streptomyces marincola]
MVQAGNVTGGIHFHGEDRPVPLIPRQLPGRLSGFVNRADELVHLDALLPAEVGGSLDTTVCVVAGTAGAGKTSLVLRWAHQVRDRFPDGQLYINLRGYDPGQPVAPPEALHRFLTALGVPAGSVPADPDAAAALYRSLLAERATLLVLDNAATAAQVRPLLPGNSRSLAIVTSRSRLSGLAIRDGAHRLTLGTLGEPEAVALIRAVTAGHRPEDERDKLIQLARLCAHLPLALRIAAERAATRPHLRIDDLIAELRDESALWDALSAGEDDDAEAIRSVFAWSYRSLPTEAARLFRLLGLHPGPEFGLHAAAALAGTRVNRARQLLDTLVGAHLLEQTAPDRYEFHDLLRAYAADQARNEEPADRRSAALRRVLDWYLHTADAAQSWLEPEEAHWELDPPDRAVTPLSFPDYDAAASWSEHEHANILAATRAAEAAGLDAHAWQLPAVLYLAQAPSASALNWLDAGRTGLAAARRLGERAGEAALLEDLGMTYARLSDLAASEECHRAALSVRRELGDRYGQANSLNLLGLTHLNRRRLNAAGDHFEQAISLFRDLGAEYFEAVARANLALTHYRAGRLAAAEEIGLAVLSYQRAAGNRLSEGNTLWTLSDIQCERGDGEGALRTAQDAVEIALGLRNQFAEAIWLISLGNAQRALGQYAEALSSHQRSASLHRRLRNRSREALAWLATGETYRSMGRPEEAVGFHRQAVDVFRDLSDAWHEAVALDALAAALDGEDADRARRHRTHALELIGDYEDPRAVRFRQDIERRLSSPD